MSLYSVMAAALGSPLMGWPRASLTLTSRLCSRSLDRCASSASTRRMLSRNSIQQTKRQPQCRISMPLRLIDGIASSKRDLGISTAASRCHSSLRRGRSSPKMPRSKYCGTQPRESDGLISGSEGRRKQQHGSPMAVRAHRPNIEPAALVRPRANLTLTRAYTSRVAEILHGRAVTMSYQQPSRNQTTSFSVWMGGIGEGVSERDISRFLQQHGGTAPDSVTLGPLPFSEKRAGKIVEGLLTSIGPLASYEEAPRPRAALKCKALAKFARASDAQEACRRLDSQKTSALGGGKLFLSRVFSAKFVLLNPVYAVVRSQMTPLLDLLASADHSAAGLVRHKTFPSEASTTISLQADTPVAIAFAKGMLSPIFNGECISLAEGEGALWHVRFSYPEVETELQQLNTVLAGGALVIRDTRRRELRVWGEEALRRTAIAAVRKLMQGFMNHQSVLPLPPEEFVIFLRLGLLDELKAACSAHSASLNLNTRSVLIEGDAQVVQRAIVFLAARLSENAGAAAHEKEAESHLCSVCYCPPDEPVKLSCAHEYCGSCLRNWMKATSSAGGGPGFPIECLADGCKQLVSIADLSKALSNEDLHALRRAALDEHVNANLDRLQFCISAGCGGLFPLNDARTSHCSACRLCICTSCKVEEHEGLTCQQYLQAKAPPDRLRMRVIEEILTLQCPRCGQAFLDFEGCFALKCSKCPCGFCGWCLADCGSDAHAHVRTCTAKPPGADIFFGSHTQFVEAQRKRQALKLREFFATLPAAEKDGLMQSLATDLRDLGLQL